MWTGYTIEQDATNTRSSLPPPQSRQASNLLLCSPPVQADILIVGYFWVLVVASANGCCWEFRKGVNISDHWFKTIALKVCSLKCLSSQKRFHLEV